MARGSRPSLQQLQAELASLGASDELVRLADRLAELRSTTDLVPDEELWRRISGQLPSAAGSDGKAQGR